MVIGQKIGYDHDSLDFAHGQRLKLTNFDHMTMLTLNFRRCSWSKMIKFDHMTAAILKFWLCSWSNIFDHMTISQYTRIYLPSGQKNVVVLLPPG